MERRRRERALQKEKHKVQQKSFGQAAIAFCLSCLEGVTVEQEELAVYDAILFAKEDGFPKVDRAIKEGKMYKGFRWRIATD